MPSGASFGDGYGPVVVSRTAMTRGDLAGRTVATPGELTTAHLALRLWQPEVKTVSVGFDEIFEAVQDGAVDAGVVIHEGQLTYQDEGLRKMSMKMVMSTHNQAKNRNNPSIVQNRSSSGMKGPFVVFRHATGHRGRRKPHISTRRGSSTPGTSSTRWTTNHGAWGTTTCTREEGRPSGRPSRHVFGAGPRSGDRR